MKVVDPSRLLAEAADVLAQVRADVVVVGAAALEVALASDSSVVITPTRDVDVVIPVERAAAIVSHLEAADMHRSEIEHERPFTWVRGDLRVQLVRNLHPFAKPPAKALPANPVFGMATKPADQITVAGCGVKWSVKTQCSAGCGVVSVTATTPRSNGTSRPLQSTDSSVRWSDESPSPRSGELCRSTETSSGTFRGCSHHGSMTRAGARPPVASGPGGGENGRVDRAVETEAAAPIAEATAVVARRPGLTTPQGLIALQRVIGNRATGRLVAREATAERELDKRWQVTPGSIPDAQAETLVTTASHAVVFWVNYDLKNQNNSEFENAATDFAKHYGTLGMRGDDKAGATLKGGIPIEVKSRDDLVQAIVSIRQTLHQLWWQRYRDSDEQPDDPRIGTVAIFCHGERDGLGIDHANAAYTKEKHLPALLGAIRPALTDDVKFLLYACSSGGGPDETIDQTKMDTGLGGKGSFAEKLATALGGRAEVYAHEVAGNVASNVYARRFTAGQDEGTSMFDVLYGDGFVASEAARLRADKTTLVGGYSDAELQSGLKAAMWRHYRDAVASDFVRINSHDRHFGVGGYTGVGGAMFMNESDTRTLLRSDFQTYWLDDATITNGFKRPPQAGAAK